MKTKQEKHELFLNNYDTWALMNEAEADVRVAIKILKRENRLPYVDNLRDCAEKYLDDNTTETELVSEVGTRRSVTRAERRRATRKAKRRLAEIYNHPFHNDSVRAVVRNGKEVAYVKEGDTWSWRKEWRRMNHRIRRHEGKRECYEYIPEEVTETKADISMPYEYTTEKKFSDYPENGFYVVVYWPDWCMEAVEIHCCRLSAAVKAFENHKSESSSLMAAHFNNDGYLRVDETIAYYKD